MIRHVQIKMVIAILFILSVAAVSAAQQTSDPKTGVGPPTTFSSSTIERTYAAGAAAPTRQLRTRTEFDGREIVTETTETPGPDGKLRPSRETTTQTVRTGTDSTQTKHEVFSPDAQGRRSLIESTQTDVQLSTDGSSRSVANTVAPDLNGRLELSRREIQVINSPAPDVKQTDTSIFRPGINEPLLESERVQQIERQIGPDLTQNESTRLFRDGNGRWQPSETWNQEVRTAGDERVVEETVHRLTDYGTLALSERRVTRQFKKDGQDQTVTEMYSQGLRGSVWVSNVLQLNERVQVTTTAMPDGGQQTIREVEGRNPVAPTEPLRVIERTVETFSRVGPDRWEIRRQVFGLDGNGRVTPIVTERGESEGIQRK
jgi:hypothetical protein